MLSVAWWNRLQFEACVFILAMLCTHSVKCLCAQTDCSQPVCVVDQKEGNISVSSTCVFLPPIVSTWQVLPGLKGKKSISEFLATLWKLFACDSKQSCYNKMERKKCVRSSVYFCRDVSCISNCAGLQCECVLFLAHLIENRHCSMENITWMADAPKGQEERSHLGMGWPAGSKELVSVSPIAVILPGGWWTFDQYWVLHSTKADSSLASLQSPALESLLAEVIDKKSGCLGQVFSGS